MFINNDTRKLIQIYFTYQLPVGNDKFIFNCFVRQLFEMLQIISYKSRVYESVNWNGGGPHTEGKIVINDNIIGQVTDSK